ncbi:hypothetical protein OG21DRAFT_1177121 [Imleria badia]|nr:hypothetical protein OG21DRAFT_1177121 [Imleria badia]
MSSDLQSVLEYFQMNDYIAVVIATAIIYDYLLNFSREVEYVWHRPWTWVSTIFVLVRYTGLSWPILFVLSESSYTGSVKVGTAIILGYAWESLLFFAAADLVMILRVYAMWNRSKRILYILLFLYVPQELVSFIFTGVFDNPNTYLSVITIQVANFSACSHSVGNATLTLSTHLCDGILRIILSITLFILAVTQTLKQSVGMYKATKQWQLNQYIKQLIGDGILYFLVYVVYTITVILPNVPGITSTNPVLLFMASLSLLTMPPMMPRFIISIRELYECDLRRRRDGIDSGFGVLSQPLASGNAVVSAIAIADINSGQTEGQDQDRQVAEDDAEDLEAEQLGDGTRQVVGGAADGSEAIHEVLRDGACRV